MDILSNVFCTSLLPNQKFNLHFCFEDKLQTCVKFSKMFLTRISQNTSKSSATSEELQPTEGQRSP